MLTFQYSTMKFCIIFSGSLIILKCLNKTWWSRSSIYPHSNLGVKNHLCFYVSNLYVSTAGKWLFTFLYCIIVPEYTALSHLFGIYSCNTYSSDKLAIKFTLTDFFPNFKMVRFTHPGFKQYEGVCCARNVIIKFNVLQNVTSLTFII